MGTLTAGFAIAWLGLAGYVAWLAHRQRDLGQRLEQLRQADEREYTGAGEDDGATGSILPISGNGDLGGRDSGKERFPRSKSRAA